MCPVVSSSAEARQAAFPKQTVRIVAIRSTIETRLIPWLRNPKFNFREIGHFSLARKMRRADDGLLPKGSHTGFAKIMAARTLIKSIIPTETKPH
jgi:hypothetical protein